MQGTRETSVNRRPFWLPASNYYVLTAAVSVAFFFLLWGILQEGLDETPRINAGIGAGFIFCLAVFLREVILRSARNRFLLNQKRLDKSVRGLSDKAGGPQRSVKLTLEKNAALLKEMQQKSDAAKILGKFSEGHKSVSDLCEVYLAAVAEELPNVRAGSPRIAALRNGRKVADQIHRFHLLQWAEIETRSLMQEANARVNILEKLEIAQKTISIVTFALQFYPNEKALRESEEVLRDFAASINVSNWVEKAERAFFKGDHKGAINLYKDALFDLDLDNTSSSDRIKAAQKIKYEIERIEQMQEKG